MATQRLFSLICIFFLFCSVLKTFIHDPLVEWEKVKGRSSSEAANEKVIIIYAAMLQVLVSGIQFVVNNLFNFEV